MTTKITVDAHAGWPVEVTLLDNANIATAPPTIVQPNTTQDFYVYEGRNVLIKELNKNGPT